MNNVIPLRSHLSHKGVEQNLRRILDFFANISKDIALEIKTPNGKYTGTQNSSGDKQLELDVWADEHIKRRLEYETSFSIRNLVSEERDTIVRMDTKNGIYSVAIDPLDGSSVVDSNLSIGTIMSVHEGDILNGRTGRESLVATMYVVYGPVTTLTYTANKGTHEFWLNNAGSFVLKRENINLKEKGKIYSAGGLRSKWIDEHKNFIESLENEGYKSRYSGALVADVNQILVKGGGIFSYPALKDAENGKLRLLVELYAMAALVEQANGAATDGLVNILDKTSTTIEQRSSVYLGSKFEVETAKLHLTKN